MGVNLSIKNAPEAVVKRLKIRAVRHHRSLQGELIAILETVANEEALLDTAAMMSEVQRLGLRTPAESVAVVREDRDAR
ncbi:MAG: FitA-like ribbon-helix-helix domain-containing protein [Gammaproteobacteria bacterium]